MGPRRFQKKHSRDVKTFAQLVEEVLDHGEQEEVQLFVGIARRLWHCRNDVVFNGNMFHPTLLVRQSVRAREEFLKTHDLGIDTTVLPSMKILKWTAPDIGWLKLNWDASLASNKDWIGMGLVLRDEKGRLIAAHSKTFYGRLDVLKAEAKAALLAIQLCKSLGFSQFH